MNKKNGSGTGLFMMEMIVAVCFFILCASTCILVFVKADTMSRLARDTNSGVVAAESMAEVWKAEGSDGLAARLEAQIDGNQGKIFWDKSWNTVTGAADAAYLGELTWEAQDGLETAQIVVSRTDNQELFSMTVSRYLREQS